MAEFVKRGLDEVAWQHKIIKTERARGHFGGKWSSSTQTGKPDLILHFPDVGGVLMEVKLFRGIKNDDAEFSRKIETTPKQREELEKYSVAGGIGVVGVVTDYGGGKARLWVLPWHAERLDTGFMTAYLGAGSWSPAGFDVQKLVLNMSREWYYK